MGKKLTPQQREELRANMQTLIDDGKDESIVSKYRDSYIDKYGTDDLLKKKVDSQPSVSPSKPKVTQPFSLLESSGNVSYTGGLIEDYNAKVKEQERLKKEETTKKLGSLNIDFAKTGLDIKAIGNEIKTKLKDATIGEIEAFNEVISENTKKNGTSYLGFKQSSIGKANELISDVKNGIELSQEDEAYLKQTSPKAYNELLSSSNVISVDVNSIARQKKKEKQELFSFSANQDMVQSANDLRQLGIDVNNISANKAVQELAKVESYYSAKLNELNVKYPEKVSGYTGSVYKDNYNPIVKRDDAYAEEKAELDEQYNGVKERIGKLNAYQYALKNKNADVESVGEEVLKVADPIRYNNFVKGGKKSADVKEDLHNLGYHILQSTNDAELINKGRNAEQEHDNKYPNQLIQETKKRIASEYVKSIGGEDYVANKGSLSIEEADKFIDQLPQKYKKAYLEKIRPYAINQNGVTSSITDVNDANFNPGLYTNKELSPRDASIELPNLGGAVNKFIQGYTQPIEGVFNFALDRLDSDGKVNRALEKPKMYEQELAKSKELKDQINQLKAKPKLTVQEATELSQKQQELQVQKPFKEVVDGSFSLLGQVIGQAALSEVGTPFVSSALNGVKIGTKTIGFTDKANKIATYASEIKNIKGASASMVAYASSYSDAEKEAINLGLDGWKKALYSNVIAGLNAGTERIFKDEKVLDAFNAEVSPLIGDMVRNLTTRGVTNGALTNNLIDIISRNYKKFAKNMVVENQKEAGEELATQLGTSIIKGLLAPDQFNTQEELDAMKQVWYETTIYGGITSFGAAVTETRNSNVSKKAMYELGSNNAEINKFIDVVNTQVSKGKMSQEDANDKIKAVNTMQQIVQKSIPLIDSKRKLTSSEKVKLSNILLAERKLQDEIKNPNFSDVKSLNEKELSKVQDLKNKILNNEVFIDDNLDVYTEDEYNAKRDAENATPSNKIIQYNNDGTLTIKDANGVFIENFNGTIDEYYKKQVESTAKAEIEKIQEEIDSYDEEYNGLVDLVNKEDRKLNTPKSENEIKLNQLQNKIQKLRDRRDKLKSEPLLSNEQPISTTQSESNPTTLKNGDKYTDAKGVERIWGENTEADKTHEIEQMLKATAEGAAMGATIQSVEDFKSGKETIFRKPQSIEAAKNNPNYNVEIQSDGSAKVIGVLDPRNNEWVGVNPESKIDANVQLDEVQSIQSQIDELVAKRKAEYDNALVGKENLSQTVKDNLNKKISANYNPQIDVLQKRLDEIAKNNVEAKVESNPTTTESKSTDADNALEQQPTDAKADIEERSESVKKDIDRLEKIIQEGVYSDPNSNVVFKLDSNGNFIGYVVKDNAGNTKVVKEERPSTKDDTRKATAQRDKDVKQLEILNSNIAKKLDFLLNKLGSDGLTKFLETFDYKQRGTLNNINSNSISNYYLNNYDKLKSIEDKINAKYNAELDALESKPTDAKADIDRRRKELTTFTSKRTFIKGVAHEIQIGKKFNQEGFDVDVSNKADTSTGFLYSNALSEHFDTIEEAIEYANQIIQGDKEYIKKVDAELDALEQQPTSTTQSESNSALKSFNSVPKVSNTKEEGQKAQEQVFSIASNLGVGTVIKNGDGIQIVTENSISKNGRHTIGITEFERQEDGSLIQTGDTQFVTKNNEGQIKSDYNPHTTYTNSKGERVTETAEITTDKIDLSKEKVFVNSNDDIVESKAFSTTGVQEAPKTGQQPTSTQSESNPALSDVESTQNDFQYVIDKANKAGGGVKGSGTKKINLSDRETAILNKTIEKLEAKAVANNGASFDPNETINIQYEKINGKEQKINTYTVDGYSIKYKYNSGKSMTEITTPQGDLLIVSKQYGKTEIAYLGKSESLLSKEQTPAKKESPVFDDKNKTKEEIVITPKKVDILDEVTDEKIGEKEVSDFKVTLNDGASAFGVIEGEVAKIVGIQAPKKEGSVIEPKRGTKTYERVIDKLREKGIKTIQVSLQSQDSQKALSGLVEKGIIGNARDMQGVSDSQFPTTFDILSKEQTPAASDVESKSILNSDANLKGAKETILRNGVESTQIDKPNNIKAEDNSERWWVYHNVITGEKIIHSDYGWDYDLEGNRLSVDYNKKVLDNSLLFKKEEPKSNLLDAILKKERGWESRVTESKDLAQLEAIEKELQTNEKLKQAFGFNGKVYDQTGKDFYSRLNYLKSHPEKVVLEKAESKEPLVNNKLRTAIAEGRMTANDAKAIIESAGLEVPKEIESLLSKEQAPQPKNETKENEAVEVESNLNQLGVNSSWFNDFKSKNPNTLLGIEDKKGFITIINERGEGKKIEPSDFINEVKTAISNGYKGIAKITEKDLATQTKEVVKNKAKRDTLQKVVLDEGDGIVINDLFNEWNNIKNQKESDKWKEKIKTTKFGTYGTVGLMETIKKFNPKINDTIKRNFYTEIESALGIPKDQRTYKPYVFEKPTSKPTPNETKENEAVFDVESVAKDNDTEESIKEKLKNPFGKKVVIEGVEYTITDVGRGAGSPDITLTDKDGNIFYEEQKTFDGRIIKKLPTKSTLIDIAKNQKPTENLAEQAAETPEQSIKEIELKRDSDVRELSKYRIEINLPTIKEIVNSKDPIGNKWKYSAIKEKITMLDKLINCL